MSERWPNQEEAFQFAMEHPSTMLDMDMGTGKTRVAIDVAMARDVKKSSERQDVPLKNDWRK